MKIKVKSGCVACETEVGRGILQTYCNLFMLCDFPLQTYTGVTEQPQAAYSTKNEYILPRFRCTYSCFRKKKL